MDEKKTNNTKVILCNRSALKRKYGECAKKIEESFDFILGADEENGISSCLVMLDDEKQMKKTGEKAVKDCFNMRQNKKAVDAVVRYYNPDLITLFGAPDIIPLQELSGDNGKILTDLPYACKKGYGTSLNNFLQPERKVTRVPDVYLGKDQTFKNQKRAFLELYTMIVGSSQQETRGIEAYSDPFVLTANEEKGKQAKWLENHFLVSGNIRFCLPLEDQEYIEERCRMHYLDLYGAPNKDALYDDPNLKKEVYSFHYSNYNEENNGLYPVYKKEIKIKQGAIVLNLSSYGAQLSNCGGYQPLPNVYLLNGAAVYAGSTGEVIDHTYWQPLFQTFFQALVAGESLGEAYLSAAKSLAAAEELDVKAKKVMAQWTVMGDSSFRPIKPERKGKT